MRVVWAVVVSINVLAILLLVWRGVTGFGLFILVVLLLYLLAVGWWDRGDGGERM